MGPRAEKQKNINFYKLIGKLIIRNVNNTKFDRFVLHILQRDITHLVVITRKTNIKLGILKGGTGKEPKYDSLSLRKSMYGPRIF